MLRKAWWLPRRGVLQDPSRWRLLGLLALLALAGRYFFGGSGEAGEAGRPVPAPAIRPEATAKPALPEAVARMLAESGRVGRWVETLREIEADIARSRANPCGSPLLFVLRGDTWHIGSRGAFLPIAAEDFPPGWHDALQLRARRGQRIVAEADLYRAEGNC